MNRYVLLIALVAVLRVSEAQEQGTPPTQSSFTLDQAISFALENNVNLKNARVDERIAQGRVKETRGIGLPQVDASVSVLHNQKLPKFFGTYTDPSSGGFSFFGEIDGAQPGDVVAGRNFFQLPTSGDAKLAISQILFNSSYLVGLQAANAYKDLAVKNTNVSREQTIQNVSKAFYLVLINNERVQLFDANIARVDSLLRTTSALFENGFAESIDVDRIKVTLNNLKVEQSNFLRLKEVALQMLKFQMNYPMESEIALVGNLSDLKVDSSVLSEYSLNWGYEARSDYQLLEANRKLQSLNLKNKYAEGLPSLVAFANLGYQTQSRNIGGIFRTNTDIPDNSNVLGNGGPDKWYSYSNFGVSLNVPLFSGLQRNYRVQQAKLELQKTENNFANLKAGIDLEIKQVAATYLSAVERVESQKQNADLATNIARVTKIKFEQGVGSNLEVVEAEAALREAQVNYYSALYDAIVAKIDLDKAYGKLAPATQTNNK